MAIATSYTTALTAMLLPFLAFAVIIIATRKQPKLSAGISIGAIAVSFGCALYLLVHHWHLEAPLQYTREWAVSGNLIIPFGVLLDPLSLVMLLIVTTISLLVQIYSLGYMAGDKGFARYYAFMSLFAWAMTSLTLSPTMVQLYIFWELVGLASYLLIGFWYEKFSASTAGKKAFVMTRLGDVAFLLGLLLVLGYVGNLNILDLNSPDITAQMPGTMITLGSLLIFGGVIGKSAQFPLLTWLPDAMEGPTPVSALLHSATMVAAGVYLFGRLFPFFSHSATAMTICLGIGTISMLLASTMAMVSRDIKQVWAYSTISQLGFMIMALAAGGYFAGVFHLTTHAGFKALLFLCSGVFIHAYGSNDMFTIGAKGGRGMKIPMVCMTIGAAALSGLPPLSGFFSKELILAQLAHLNNPLWLGAGLLGAFLTAYYSFRLIFIILFPASNSVEDHREEDHTAHDHGHSKSHYLLMAVPLLVLASVTLVLGLAQDHLTHFLTQTLAATPHPEQAHSAGLLYLALVIAGAGVVLAWIEFGRPGAAQIGWVERIPFLKTLFSERWYVDHFYRFFLDHIIYKGIARFCAFNDSKVIDAGLDALANGTLAGGRRLSMLHLTMVQYKLMVIFAVLALIALYFIF